MSLGRSGSPELPSLRTMAGTALGVALANLAAMESASAQLARPGSDTPLPTVPVQGADHGSYQVTLPSLNKMTEPLLDTPQSVSVLPQQLLQDQGVTTMRDALRNVPGISLAAGEGGAQGDNLSLRGFSARNDFYLDGMRDFGSYYRDPFNQQEVEVLKGPSSLLFGRGSTGGVINQVSKQPELRPITRGTLGFGTDGTRRVTTDVGRAIPGLEGAAVRLNFMADQNGVAGRDNAAQNRFGFAPSVSFGLGTSTRANLSYLHEQAYDVPDYGLPWLGASPAPVARQNWYGFKDSDYLRTDVDIVTAKIEHDINDAVTVRDQFRYGSYRRGARVTEPQILGSITAPLDSIAVNRNEITVLSTETFLQNQADATLRFATGFIRHTVVAGFEIGRETSDPTRVKYNNVPTTSLLSPNSDIPLLAPSAISTNVQSAASTFAAYVMDTLKIGEQLELIGGIRWDRFDFTYNQSVAPVSNLHSVDEMPSVRAGIVYKPAENGSIYFAYGTSFNPSAEALSLSASTADLAPEKNRSFEVGTKWDIMDSRLSLSGALFRIEKTNARETSPLDATLQVLAGNQVVDGFELSATGHLTDAWQIYGGYAYLNGRTVSSPNPADLGHATANTPRNTFSVWSTYKLPWYGIQIGGGVNYVDSRTASTTPVVGLGQIRTAPSYWTIQAMAKMPVTPNIDLQANVYNVTNQYYLDELHPGHVIPGAARAALFSLNFKL